MDWTNSTGPVYDQQSCGCCYAFAMTNAIESNYFIKTGKAVVLSRQQIVDCNPLTHGCNGGDGVSVGRYARAMGFDSSYKAYTATAQKCTFNSATASNVYIQGVEGTFASNVNYNSKSVNKALLNGPTFVGLDATQLKQYKSGVLDLNNCQNETHAVFLVGMTVDQKTGWLSYIIKNSWGTWWGQSGYFLVRVSDTNPNLNCFIHGTVTRPFA